MVVFQYRKTTTSVTLRLRMAERCSWTTACILKVLWLQIFCNIWYALAKEKWCVVGLAFAMNKICPALNYVPVRVAISVWILFRDREKMTEILKATRKMMQISRVFIIILILNEITCDFFSLCRANAFPSSFGCQSSLIHFSWLNNSFLFHFKLTLIPNDMIC
jgi:hypothetical protein